ncbi:hypothetical protein LINPERPRIM_LOCUS17227 [Linum perenne]
MKRLGCCALHKERMQLEIVAILFLASSRHWQTVWPDEKMLNYNLRTKISSPHVRIKIFSHNQEKWYYPATHRTGTIVRVGVCFFENAWLGNH